MRIARVWGNDNGYGLSKDYAVIKPLLEAAGFAVERSSPNRPAKGKTDIAIHLEHIYARNLELSPVNVAIPNVEWCPPHMVTAMRRCTHVVAKTHSAAYFLRNAGIESIFTGWTSPDIYDGALSRHLDAVHIAGRSPLKNTNAVIQAMRHLPGRMLHVFAPRNLGKVPDNVIHHKVNLTAERAVEVINMAMIHVLPSQYEGFGHMLNEAAACDARIVTTDHEPMRMFDDRFLVPVSASRRQGLATMAVTRPEDIAEQIERAIAWSGTGSTRDAYLARDAEFKTAMGQFVSTL